MHVVINQNEMTNHVIDKYEFKVLGMDKYHEEEVSGQAEERSSEENHLPSSQVNLAQETNPTGSRDELVESLLQKTADVTTNLLQMKKQYDAKEEAFKSTLELVKKEAYDEGVKAGRTEITEEISSAENEKIDQFASSIKTVETRALSFEQSLGSMQDDLLQAALDIAKEVIDVEIEEHASSIAKKLSSQLIASLKGASKVTLKVNPADYGVICEHVGRLEYVEVLSDSAVGKGGVIAISDTGNMDADIKKRYERVKRAALSG